MELPDIKTDKDEPDFVYYMFINSSSGGFLGKHFNDLEMDSVRFIVGASEVMVRFYDLKDPVSSSKGLRRLKNHMSKMEKDKVRVIICGGDGTVGWVLSVLEDAKIKVEELIFGIFPLGTGNDFARVLNWGPGEEGDIVGPKLGRLKKLVENWVSADVIQFDVWHVKVTVHENGHFEKVEGKVSAPMDEQLLSRHFTNYCGFGMDGQIGYNFDKNRSESKAMNLLIYAGVGFLNLFKKPVAVETLVEKMSSEEEGGEKKEIFNNEEGIDRSKLKEGFKNMLALNVNSFMGGITDIWETESSALEGNSQVYLPQKYNDGCLEFVSWRNEMELVMEMVVNNAYKVSQGPGPFEVNFKQIEQKEHHTFVQIDGEFFKVYHPKDIVYSKSPITPTGQIRVLSKRLD